MALRTASVVVPAVSDTTDRSWPVTAFTTLDLPALHTPKKAICTRSPEGVSFMPAMNAPAEPFPLSAISSLLIYRTRNALLYRLQFPKPAFALITSSIVRACLQASRKLPKSARIATN